jgi:hypothetical protein
LLKKILIAITLLSFNSNGIEVKQEVKQEVDYKILYENQNEYLDSMLATVYWSLSSIILIIITIIGSNIFLNFRLNKQQFEELRAEVHSDFSHLNDQALDNFNDVIQRNMDAVQKDLFKSFDSNEKNQHDKYINFETKITNKIENIKESFEIEKTKLAELLQEINSRISKQNKVNLDKQEYIKSTLQSDIDILQYEILSIILKYSVLKNSHGSIIDDAVRLIEQAIRIKYDFAIGYALKDIKLSLKNHEVSVANKNRLRGLANILPSEYQSEFATIENLLSES